MPRPIFYFVPVETQRHLCHMPKTRYVLADYGWSPPCSVSKPFIETINERDLLNSTAPLFPPSPVPLFFRRWQRAQRLSKSASEKLPIRTCMASDTHTVQPRRFPILSFLCFFLFFFILFFFFSGRANELTASALIIALRRRMIDRAARAASAGNYGNIIQFI